MLSHQLCVFECLRDKKQEMLAHLKSVLQVCCVAYVLSENDFLSQLHFSLRLRLKITPMKGFVSWFLFFVSTFGFVSGQQADYEDYCAMLGEDDIQGMKHGFLAGNKVYYVHWGQEHALRG